MMTIDKAFRDREAATRFANSLLADGWDVSLEEVKAGEEWRVQAVPTPQIKLKKRKRV